MAGLIVLVLGGCGRSAPEERFVATIAPLQAIAGAVAGEAVGVMIPAGASPHTYEPKPSDARHVARSLVLLYGSDDLDGWAASLDGGVRIQMISLVPDSLRRSAYGVHGTDPHFWMDPLAVAALAPRLADVFCQHASDSCAAYQRNAADFAEEMRAVHDSLRILMAPVRGRSVILAHAFLQYFADRYGLEIAGVIEEMAGSEPSPRDMQRIAAAIRARSAKAVFTLPQHSSRAAEALADAAGIPVIELDPIGAANDVSQLLYINAQRIRDALVDFPAPDSRSPLVDPFAQP